VLKSLLGQLFRPRRETAREAGPMEEQLRAALGHQQSGRLAEAETIYRALLGAVPPHADVMHLLASNLMLQRRHHEAVALLERVTSLQPQSAEVCYNLGGALNALGKYERAAQCFEKALDLRPDFAEALSSLGNTLTAAGRLDEAELSYRRALGLRPDFAEAVYNLGNLLHLGGRLAEAIDCYRRAFTLRPSFVAAHSNYVYALNFDPGYEPQRVFEEHLQWARSHAEPLRRFIPHHANEAVPGRRLRIGYVSPNFRNHAAAYFFEPVLACHDARQFQIFCYSDVLQADEYTARLRQFSSEWRECAHLTDEELAEQILRDRIDILVDLTGHTKRNRLLVFARKPAPIQVTWNGYANTTGMSAMDYRITDALADPPGMTEHLHTEQLIRMPDIYMVFRPPDDSPAVNNLPAAQSGRLIFGSFNALSKLTPQVVQAWSRILSAVPGARLLLATLPAGRTRERVCGMFAAHGVESSRLELHGRLPLREFLALHHQADIALDPFPFGGTTTTCHSLWMGLPVVTLAGKSHVSRVGVSMLTNIGLTGMIARSVDDYVNIATGLAGDLGSLRALRDGLRDRMLSSPLTDAGRFTRHLEERFRQIWTTWCGPKTSTEKVPAT
jgi:predicted O-linked N-acetylglucosamine transferase (SPINDLY family)